MTVARHGRGVPAATRALGSQVHPVFMLPPLATSLFGAVLAGRLAPAIAALHVLAVFFALYAAHVVDGYVDFYVRGEDDDHPLSAGGCRLALALATAGFLAAVALLGVLVDLVAVALTLPGWLIAVNHAPTLDTNPLGATLGYPFGVALALLGGYYVQVRTLSPTVLGLAGVFLVVLCGIKVIDDAQDVAYDRSIDKRTVAVVLGPRRARRVAFGLLALGMAAVLGLVVASPVVPPGATVAVVAFGAVATVARRAGPELATMLLVRGSYLFLAGLVGAVWFRPLG